ncbi:hypothetical protein GYMLUDRAFT_242014 [Collybiopsis luxurians FD-317 M1]|uniref:Uncharacterized protein n=1 Tax=Collybiopsis luxurians FD-317 M1 TaxID=944289 RepID=A0A0D0C448_9AGAR|nr:hypothetical protein GYMLUDRAFT_242014 [Collybiopsis luxurians FD-317 M1]
MIRVKPKPAPSSTRSSTKTKSTNSQKQSSGSKGGAPSVDTNPNIHRDRAKRWGTNPWVAEWFANAVEYMKDAKAQKDFEAWVKKNYPSEEASRILIECKDPPVKRCGASTGNAKMWNSAAFELVNEDAAFEGVSDTAMKQYHRFTSANMLVEPERKAPAISRKRSELSSKWLVRREESLLNGCQVPDIDWVEARRIAISQLDEITYTYEAWHKDFEYFMTSVIERSKSTVPVPQALPMMHDPRFRDRQLRLDAYRSKLQLFHLGRAHWTLAVSLLEELEQRGLRKTPEIEAAYRTEPRLKWRLVGMAAMTVTFASKIASRTEQVLAALPAFSKYFKRYRTAQGVLCVDVDYAYIRDHPYPRNSIDELIVQVCSSRSVFTLDQALTPFKDYLNKFPQEALKFDDVAWHIIGEYIVVSHFVQEICISPFGRRLHEAATESRSLSGPYLDLVFDEVAFMKRLSLSISSYHDHEPWNYGRCRGIAEAMYEAWGSVVFNPGLKGSIIEFYTLKMHSPSQFEALNLNLSLDTLFNMSWFEDDEWLWEKAKEFDRPGKENEGRMAKLFGLYHVKEGDFPAWWNRTMSPPEERPKSEVTLEETPSKPVETHFVSSIPVAGPLDSAVQSGHAYAIGSSNGDSAKLKVKTRPAVSVQAEQSDEELKAEEEEEVSLPEFLPTNFKLPKKIHKTFQRILEKDEDTNLPPDAPKKGQVRWEDFEKAMKRVGFDVVQTAGSSVRFDPPAKMARPISFHRPHPDSLLNPVMIKWIGSRLNRCYGWTTATFLLSG